MNITGHTSNTAVDAVLFYIILRKAKNTTMKELIKQKWEEILASVKVEYNITDVSFRTWLLPLQVFDVKENVIKIAVDDGIGAHSVNFIKNRYGLFLKTAIAEQLNQEFELEFVLLSAAKAESEQSISASETKSYAMDASRASLNPKYTFDTFIVGSNNNLAHAAALAVAESPGEVYNPLFIYGGAGLGKTHLMHSIAHHILDNNPTAKVLYVTSEKFTNELIESIRNVGSAPTSFREKYRTNDVLLIDDIQFIIGKESTQEEFFHTFNTLHEAKKQIIISSDKSPKDILTLEERLRSRFEWGLTVDIQSPNYETRMAILRKKEEMEHLTIDDEILSYIAAHVKSNIRELEGALTKIVALSRLKKTEINLSLAEEALKDLIYPNEKRTVTLDLIVDVVAEHFGATSEELASNNRTRNIAYPRQISMYLCRKLTALPLTDIGKCIGNRDHSTVVHGINKIEKDLQKDLTLRNTIDVLIKKINPSPK